LTDVNAAASESDRAFADQLDAITKKGAENVQWGATDSPTIPDSPNQSLFDTVY